MNGVDFIGLQVEKLAQVVDVYKIKFQFNEVSTSVDKETETVYLRSGNVKLKLTGSATNNNIRPFIHPLTQEVCEIGFKVSDVDLIHARAIAHGAREVLAPANYHQPEGRGRISTISAFGKVQHTFIQREEQNSPAAQDKSDTSLLNVIDHITVCVEAGEIDRYVEFYERVYGLQQSHEEYVTTENSGMNSKVVESMCGATKIVFVEPVVGKRQSQITDYLQQYGGPCVQHIAFSTTDILTIVKKLRSNNVEFLPIPESYYKYQQEKLQLDSKVFQALKEQSILVDGDASNLLYQIFTKSMTPQPTVFFEIIQRSACTGFGSGNIKALFKAIEEEQFKREKVNG